MKKSYEVPQGKILDLVLLGLHNAAHPTTGANHVDCHSVDTSWTLVMTIWLYGTIRCVDESSVTVLHLAMSS